MNRSNGKSLVTSFIFVVALCLLVSSPARADEYMDALFATPTVQEIDAAYKSVVYQPKCEGFTLGDTYEKGQGYVIYKVSYLSDGLKQTGFYGAPTSKGAHPLVVVNHFGFDGVTSTEFPKLRKLLSDGFVIAAATYRGELGEALGAEGDMDVLGYEAHDVMNLMECAVARKEVDRKHIFMWGVSHGAGLTVSILAQSNQIKAAATAAAPTNLMNARFKKLATDWRVRPGSVEVVLQMLIPKKGIAKMKGVLGVKDKDVATIPRSRSEMLRRSPVFFADHINTPLIMYYGDQDPVAFFDDGQVITDNLKSRGVVSRLVVFPQRGHAYSDVENVQMDTEVIAFFKSYLKSDGKK
jgi:dipeptidyl aminopeptidase/acylaminoacyl peptidase